MAVCSVEGCSRNVDCRGMCLMHRKRFAKHGTAGPPHPLRRPPAEPVEVVCPTCEVRFTTTPKRPQKFCSRACYRVSLAVPACSVTGCDSPAEKRGWCGKHYQRWKAHGDPTAKLRDKAPDGLCRVCLHPSRLSIETQLLSGVSRLAVSTEHPEIEIYHLAFHCEHHLGWMIGNRNRCVVCNHPEVDDIDDAIVAHSQAVAVGLTGANTPAALRWSHLSVEFGVHESSLKRHAQPEHQARRASYELGRLNALKETA